MHVVSEEPDLLLPVDQGQEKQKAHPTSLLNGIAPAPAALGLGKSERHHHGGKGSNRRCPSCAFGTPERRYADDRECRSGPKPESDWRPEPWALCPLYDLLPSLFHRCSPLSINGPILP